MRLRILHTNDLHGKLTPGKAAFIRRIKEDSRDPCCYFDTGDCIKSGNLAIPLKPESAWELLSQAGCDAGVPGNRESHPLQIAFLAKLEGHKHPLLCANLRAKKGENPLQPALLLPRGGITVGLVGVMVPIVTARMATQAASAYLWDQPIPVAKRLGEAMRSEADCLIALTHIGYKNDLLLAGQTEAFDIVLGGHSHTVLGEPTREGETWICQGGAFGRFLGDYTWEKGKGLLSYRLLELPA